MVHAKNYETMSTFVKVMQKKTLASFFRTRCISPQPPIERGITFYNSVLTGNDAVSGGNNDVPRRLQNNDLLVAARR